MTENAEIREERNMPDQEIVANQSGSPGIDLFRPWKFVSQSNMYIIYLSILLFAIYAFWRHGFNWIALSTSLFVSLPIGFAIAFFESRSMEFRRKHRRTQFLFYLIYRTFRLFVWFIVLFFFIMLVTVWLNFNTDETIFPDSLHEFFGTKRLFEFMGISLGISLISNFLDELQRKLGNDAIYNIVFGKYHQVKQEDRLFLFIDLNHSTEIAEEMGELEFSHFLQDYYYDISEPIARYFGKVYQYVGDEIVVTWPLKKGIKFAMCVRCFFAIQKQIRRYEKQYQVRFGRVPDFKAALHGGTIVVSEVGKYKSEVAYHGDVLNTTARMLSKCHELNSEFIISDFIIGSIVMPRYLKADGLGSFQLKGKQQEVELYSVYLSAAKEEKEKKRRLNIFRRMKQKV